MTAMFVAQNNPQGIMRQAHFYFGLNKTKNGENHMDEIKNNLFLLLYIKLTFSEITLKFFSTNNICQCFSLFKR